MPPTLDDARALLAERFDHAAFRPGQERVIAALLAGRSALAVFPTGGGKSLCYQLPALVLPGTTLVVSPLIALMKDQIDDLARRGVPAARLDSSLAPDEARDVSRRVRDGSLRLLYVAPERFANERFLQLLAEAPIALFAVDEAHCISEWGHNFRPDYLKLAARAREIGAQRVLALTATATPGVVEDIRAGFAIAPDDAVVTGFHRENLLLLTTPVTAAARDETLVARLRERPPGPTIVYVTLQRDAHEVARRLGDAGLPARAYHAGLESDERAAIQDWWTGAADGIVVATIAFGMGIDRADVRYVYHRNLPKGLESYAQEIGRAGRDGAPATCELLACPDDVPVLEAFVYGDTPTQTALAGVVAELLAAPPGEPFGVAEHALAQRHDVRPLVARTLLAYLELDGVLRQGTPFYAGYRLRPTGAMEDVYAPFDAERAAFLRRLIAAGRTGRTWTTIILDDAAEALGEPRARLVAALEHLDARGLVELQASDVRQRYTVVGGPHDAAALAARLGARFAAREEAEIGRIAAVLELVELDACQTGALVAHFGEELGRPCGHCSHCRDGRAVVLPRRSEPPALPAGLDVAALAALRAAHPDALGEPRQAARLLCGITSPATTRARLARDPLFGSLAGRQFSDVLAFLEGAP